MFLRNSHSFGRGNKKEVCLLDGKNAPQCYVTREFPIFHTQISTSVSLGALAKWRKATVNFVMSVCRHGTTRLPLDGFTRNLTYVLHKKKKKKKLSTDSKFRYNRTYRTLHTRRHCHARDLTCVHCSCVAGAIEYLV
jgi:hypothetical protein